MRSILVLLILVMIGLNGKGQSVTTLPDSVLSQCCLEVTLLNGNVTTVDWVFIQYITRDGTGTKLFVEYAPNFGGIQWETQIRIQDDFDEVIERSKFIILPFTVATTDYGIHRNWIANIEENTTTGGTWIYGRFGTPAKRKFSAVEDYPTLKALLLACRPRAIVVAENGLYTEGDTVRMGGILIENTRIQTDTFDWEMIDTLTSTAFGIDHNGVYGDTTFYAVRRWGSWRSLLSVGRQYQYSQIIDTVGGERVQTYSGVDILGTPYISIVAYGNPLDDYSEFYHSRNFSYWLMKDVVDNPNYTASFSLNSNSVGFGMGEIGGPGEPGNGVSIFAYGSGTADEFIGITTRGVDNSTATVGQFLQLQDVLTGEVEFATIDLSGYLEIADTATMLLSYPNIAGYGIIKSSKTIRADTTSPNGLATRLFAKTLSTSIVAGRIAVSDGSNLVGYSNFTYTDTRPTLTFGNSTAASSTTPAFIDMGGTFSSAAGANPKLALYNSGGVTYGFGISVGQLDYITPISGSHSFYIGGSRTAYINSTSIRMPTSKTIKFDAAGASATTPMIDMSSGTTGFGVESGYLTYIAPTGVGHNFYVNGSVAGRFTSTSNLLLGTTTDVPTSILTARSTTKSSSPFPLHTLAESDAITGVQGNFDYETTQNGLRWYNGTRKAYALESTFARGTATRVPFFDANGQITDNANLSFTNSARLKVTGTAITGTTQITPTTSSAAMEISMSTNGGFEGGALLFGSQFGTGAAIRYSHEGGSGNTIGGLGFYTRILPASAFMTRSFYIEANGNATFEKDNTTLGALSAGRFAFRTSATYGTLDEGIKANGTYLNSQYATQINYSNASEGGVDFKTAPLGVVNAAMTLTSRMYLNQIGRLRLGGVASASYQLDVQGTDAIGVPRGTVAQRPTIVASTTPFRYNTDSTAIEYGESVGMWRQIATRAYARSLVSGLPTTWLKSELDAGRDVTINGTSASDFTLNHVRVKMDDTLTVGDSIIHTTFASPYRFLYSKAALRLGNRGDGLSSIDFYSDNTFSNSDFSIANDGGDILNFLSDNGADVLFRLYPNFDFVFEKFRYQTGVFSFMPTSKTTMSKELQLTEYGTGTKEAADLSKTQSNYIAGFATDGTVLDLERKRDTTIYVTDADYDLSAALTTAQINTRYNRIIIVMKVNSGASDHNTLTMPTPDANLVQCEIIAYSLDDNVTYRNDINFGTNNLLSPTGSTNTTYNLSGGQWLHIRAVDQSGYKYIISY